MKLFPKAISLLAFATLLLGINGCSSIPGSSRSAEPVLVIENVGVVDGAHGLRQAQSVVVRGNMIAQVGSAGDVRAPRGARVIDGHGKYLIPGLWDAHVHLTTFPDLGPDTWYPLLIANGVTSVRDMGSPLDKILALREAARAKGAVAPRVFIAGPLIDGPDPLFAFTAVAVHSSAETRAEIDSLKAAGVDFIKLYETLPPDVFADGVRYAHERGLPVAAHLPILMDALEGAATGVDSLEHLRGFEMSCAHNWSQLLSERRAMFNLDQMKSRLPAGSARERDLADYNAKFLPQTGRANKKLPPSAWEREQAIYTPQSDRALGNQDDARCDKVIAAFKADGVMQTPTLTETTSDQMRPFTSPEWRATLAYLAPSVRADWISRVDNASVTKISPYVKPPYVRAYVKAYTDWDMAMVGKLDKQGVKFLAGTDTPSHFLVPGFSLQQELALLVDAGLTPLEALTAATLRPAEFMRLQDKMGTIDKGKWADMVLLEANPLDNIRNTEKIATVVKDGQVYDRAALDKILADLKASHAQ